MPLNAYAPLEAVYAFHEKAERWILRRYLPGVVVGAGAERTRRAQTESVVDVFPERRPRRDVQQDPGQTAPQRCTVYLRTELRITDTSVTPPIATDVLFDPRGGAWQAMEDGRWDEARGYAVVLQRAGSRGVPPWA